MEWLSLPLVGFDTETTGLSVQEDRIFEIGLVTFENGKVVDTFSVLIDPMKPLSKESREKTGVTDDDLKGKPFFTAIVDDIANRIENKVLVGYNILSFDLPMLDAEFKRANRSLPKYWALDVLVFARQLVKGARHNLTDMMQRYGITMEMAHRALADAEAVVRLLLAMSPELPKDLDDLIKLQAQWGEEQRKKRAGWRDRKAENIYHLEQVFGQVTEKRSDGEISLGPAYLYGKELDPLRVFLYNYSGVPH